MKCCGEGTEVLRKMKKFENDNRTHNTCTYVLHGGVDPDSLLISILHLIRLLLILKVSLPQPRRRRQRVADTKAKIGREGEGRTNPIRCEGDPSRRKCTSNDGEGHMVRLGVQEELGSQVAGLTGCRNVVDNIKLTMRWFITGRRIHFITLYAQRHNTIIFASLSLF